MMPSKIYRKEITQINWEPIGSCNLKCKMCPQSLGREDEFKKKMPLEEFYKIVDQALPLGLKFANVAGSGEPLLYKELEQAIAYLTKHNVQSLIYTNGVLLTPDRFERLCQAGLGVFKVSCQGWDRESYKQWMSVDAFEKVRSNMEANLAILKERKYPSILQTNHIIQGFDDVEYQKEMYLKNWINYLGVQAEIWLAHNWGGQYDFEKVQRDKHFPGRKRRTCGRPFGTIMEIRAGGLDGKIGAVVPCPYVLGQDSKAVLGHTQDESLLDILNGEKFEHFRDVHLREAFDEIDVCKNCDQLYEVEESLVWTNIEGRKYGQSRISGKYYAGQEKEVLQ